MLLLATASWNIKEKVRSVSGVGNPPLEEILAGSDFIYEITFTVQYSTSSSNYQLKANWKKKAKNEVFFSQYLARLRTRSKPGYRFFSISALFPQIFSVNHPKGSSKVVIKVQNFHISGGIKTRFCSIKISTKNYFFSYKINYVWQILLFSIVSHVYLPLSAFSSAIVSKFMSAPTKPGFFCF